MTNLEIMLSVILWILLGLFICHKANWYMHAYNIAGDHIALCVGTVVFSPVVFVWDFINRFFIQKWH